MDTGVCAGSAAEPEGTAARSSFKGGRHRAAAAGGGGPQPSHGARGMASTARQASLMRRASTANEAQVGVGVRAYVWVGESW
eukprot:scaffold218081_cov18-Tisochrysis_lutea.AAC.1